MFFFALFVNGFSGIAAGMHMLENSYGILMVFPIWNIANGVLLLLLAKADLVNEENSIVDNNASPFQVILATIVLLSVLAVCRFLFAMHWAITFSICVAYACNVSQTVHHLFFKTLSRQREQR